MVWDKNNIINYEVMGGWPVFKCNLRTILETIGCVLNSETGNYEISKDAPVLDIFPKTYEDDGCGYGVNEKYITEISYNFKTDKPYVNIFIEKELPNVDLWVKSKFNIMNPVFNKILDKEVDLKDIRLDNSGNFEYLCYNLRTREEYGWYPEENLE